MTAFYNEIDPYAAQWLRNLIQAGLIAPGVVDERSIEDVRPDELVGYTQCHFFAGVGVWSHALRLAGVSDDTPVWTGSCPCQPFSAAGEGGGFADERHLWPAFFHLIEQCRPPVVLGEQVASKDADPWIDLVCDDLESLGYACGALAFPAASIGAPNIRDRLYWVADATGARSLPGAHGRVHRQQEGAGPRHAELERPSAAGRMENADQGQRGPRGPGASAAGGPQPEPAGRDSAGGLGNAGNEGLARGIGFPGISGSASGTDAREALERAGVHAGGMGDTECVGSQGSGDTGGCEGMGVPGAQPAGTGADGRPGPLNGFWRSADWLRCRDGRWRPVEPGTFPLASRVAGRVGQLRAYGNAINAKAAQAFIECVISNNPLEQNNG